MENKDFGKQLEVRTKNYAIAILKLSASIPDTSEGKVVKNQLSK